MTSIICQSRKCFNMNDLQLWKRLKSGDANALKEIYNLYLGSLEGYSRKFTNETEIIEDAIHDLFIQIWNKKENLSDTDSIIKYLCISLRRELIRRIEKSNRRIGIEYADINDIGFSLSIEDILIQNEVDENNRIKLHQAFKLLSDRQREALYLKYYEEMSYEQICEIMDINYQSVRNLISKGIIELRKFIILVICYLSFALFFEI